jgi:hypothetical protein
MNDERVRQLGGLENRGDTVSDSWRASGQLPLIYMWGSGAARGTIFPGSGRPTDRSPCCTCRYRARFTRSYNNRHLKPYNQPNNAGFGFSSGF